MASLCKMLLCRKLKRKSLITPCKYILCWRRNVDDIFAVIPKDGKEILLNHINSINENIWFTIENEVNQEIPFLDMKIMRQFDGSTKFTIHRKNRYT